VTRTAPGQGIRPAEPADLEQLPAVEAAADTLFAPLGLPDLPPPAGPEVWARAWRVLVTGRPVVGFAVLELVDGAVHLEQLAVHPDAQRRGTGTALLEATVAEARAHGADRVTLTTFADVPWNGPFYARHGWRELDEPTPGLAARLEHERAMGLERVGRRVAMVRLLAGG
jgi:GNAT superfamily N-acetyltransferase